MNTDIRLDVDFHSNKKVLRLIKKLGLEAAWSLQRLWCYAAKECPNGIFKDMTDPEIETLGAGWTGKPGAFLAAVTDKETRFIDVKKGVKVLHNWKIRNGWAADAERRSQVARENATKGWRKRKQGFKSTAPGMPIASKPHADGNAPSPSPSPSPKDLKDKREHGDFVLLTDSEFEKLEEKIGEVKIKEYITRLNDYLEQLEFQKKGAGVKKYASHYKTILNWATRDGATAVNQVPDAGEKVELSEAEREFQHKLHEKTKQLRGEA